MNQSSMLVTDYARIEQAILYLEANFQRQPSLKEVADHVGLSEFHFQRLFSEWAGISPKRFVQFLTADYARALLRESPAQSVLDVTYEAGLSSPGRLHDLMVAVHGATPGEVKLAGADLRIAYGFHPSPFGECLVALTARGICGLSFVRLQGRDAALAELRREWPQATLVEDTHETGPVAGDIFWPSAKSRLSLFLKGTNFQIKVWEALLRIPAGAVTTYQGIAEQIGQPSAARAVGSAVGSNSVAFLIPCHRVIRKTGVVGDYRWGGTRKKIMLAWEAAHIPANRQPESVLVPAFA